MTFLSQSPRDEAVLASNVSSHTLPKMKYPRFRCTDVSLHKQFLRSNYQHVGICFSFFSGSVRQSVFLFSPRWQSLLSLVVTQIITRGYVLASMFAFGTSSDALEQLIHDILLNTEALGSTSGVTAANLNISPHAASIRRVWHESWALCRGTRSNQQWTPSDLPWSDAPPPRRETENELRSAFQANYPGDCSIQTALQASSIGHWPTTPWKPRTVSRGLHGPKSSARRSTWSSWRRKADDTVPRSSMNFCLRCAGKTFHRLTRPLCQRALGALTKCCKSAATPFLFVEDVAWHRTRRLTPNCWPAIPTNTQPTAGAVLRICPNSCPLIAFCGRKSSSSSTRRIGTSAMRCTNTLPFDMTWLRYCNHVRGQALPQYR